MVEVVVLLYQGQYNPMGNPGFMSFFFNFVSFHSDVMTHDRQDIIHFGEILMDYFPK